ncbi:MAG: glycosyltransferase, partial [Polyangiaceae bacterium]
AELAKVASTSLCPSMIAELSRRDYDVIHMHFPNPMGVMAYLASKKPKNHRIVISWHSDIVKQKRLLRAYRPVESLLLRHASAVLCASPNYAQSSTTIRAHEGRVAIVPYGIDLRDFEPKVEVLQRAAAIRASFGKDSRLLLATGRLVYYKGFEVAVRAMAHIDAHLAIVGDGPLRGELEGLARRLGVADKVHFLGRQDDATLHAYYRACDVFVLPSIARSEAFAIVQLEAMACGRPVVNTQLDSGVPFVSRHEESGLTVPPEDPRALAAAVNRLLADDTWRRELGARGRARVEREFTKEKMAASTLAIYEEALGKRPEVS